MDEAALIDLWNASSLIVFVVLLTIGALSTSVRIINLWRHGHRRPSLIWRDLWWAGGLSLSFALVAWHRAAEAPFLEHLWWYVVSSLPALLGAGAYVLWDLFVIGHGFRAMLRRFSARPQRDLPDPADREDQDV